MAKITTGTGTSSTTTTAGPIALYVWAVALQAAGWTMVRFSNATSIVTGNTGFISTSLNAISSWVEMREPGAFGRSYVAQLLNNGASQPHNLTLMYSPRLGFVTGGTATVIPTAADSVAVCSNHGMFGNSTAIRVAVCAYDTPTNGVYPWALYCHTLGGTTPQGVMVHDAMIAGSYQGVDPEPCAQFAANSWGTNPVKFHTGFGTGSQVAQSVATVTTQLWADGARAVDPIVGGDAARRYEYYPASLPAKGVSFMVALKAQPRAWPNNFNKTTDAFAYTGGAAAGILLPQAENVDLAV
jgi:hypothetical protein